MNKAKRMIVLLLICIVTAVLNLMTVSAEGNFTTYEIDEIGMSIAIPDDMPVVTRDSEKTDEFFTVFKTDYDSTMENLKKGNIYLQAMKTDNSAVLTVSMDETEKSKDIENYNGLSEDEIDDIKKSLLTVENYKSCSIEKHNQNTYLNFYVKTESDNKTVYANQCNTVVDGKLYIITLQGSNGKKITADNKGLMESILDSVTITPSNFFTENMDIIIFSGIILLSLIAITVLFIIILKHFRNPVRKDKNLIHELAHEHRISATTQIPRKHFANADYPEDNSFMEEYAPLEDVTEDSVDEHKTVAEKVVENAPIKAVEEVPAHEVADETEETSEAVTSDESFENDSDYFDSVPEPEEMYSYTDVNNAVEDYSRAKRRAKAQKETSEKPQKNTGETVKKVFLAIGKVLLNILQTIWIVLCFIIIHCKYFCINVYRLIKRKNAQRKHKKAEEERKRLARERRQRQQAAEMNRQRQNQNRSNGELIKVHSSGQPVRRRGNVQRTRRANPGSTTHSSKRY